MTIEKGTEYQISHGIKTFFNSAETLTVIQENGKSVQFTLGEGKSHGTMPIQHLYYLLKKNDLSPVLTNRSFLKEAMEEEQIS